MHRAHDTGAISFSLGSEHSEDPPADTHCCLHCLYLPSPLFSQLTLSTLVLVSLFDSREL